MTSPDSFSVIHHPAQSRFSLKAEGETAVLDYSLREGVITFTHTGVPPALEGRGIGSKLVKTGLDYARAEGLKVVASCWFVAGYIQRKPEYADLLLRP